MNKKGIVNKLKIIEKGHICATCFGLPWSTNWANCIIQVVSVSLGASTSRTTDKDITRGLLVIQKNKSIIILTFWVLHSKLNSYGGSSPLFVDRLGIHNPISNKSSLHNTIINFHFIFHQICNNIRYRRRNLGRGRAGIGYLAHPMGHDQEDGCCCTIRLSFDKVKSKSSDRSWEKWDKFWIKLCLSIQNGSKHNGLDPV
jgi:hypothetical protein